MCSQVLITMLRVLLFSFSSVTSTRRLKSTEAAGAAWYRERALAMDDLSGQLSLAAQMLKIAQRRGYKQRIGPILHQLE